MRQEKYYLLNPVILSSGKACVKCLPSRKCIWHSTSAHSPQSLRNMGQVDVSGSTPCRQELALDAWKVITWCHPSWLCRGEACTLMKTWQSWSNSDCTARGGQESPCSSLAPQMNWTHTHCRFFFFWKWQLSRLEWSLFSHTVRLISTWSMYFSPLTI